MGDSLSKIVSLIIAGILIFIVPIVHMFNQQDDISRLYVVNKTIDFADAMRNLGYVTQDMYEDYTRSLSATNNVYSIQLEHYNKRLIPNYDDPRQIMSFQGSYTVHYQLFINREIMSELSSSNETYYFKTGDYITVKVVNSNKTLGTKIKELLWRNNLPVEHIFVSYGGMVKNETY